MELERMGNTIRLKNKELNNLDRLVLDFISLIDFDYVIVSGYVAILFGRSRTTEDIDLFINPRSEEEFHSFCNSLKKRGFNLLNAADAKEAYGLLKEGISLRVIKGEEVFPNFELKLMSSSLSKTSMSERIKLILDDGQLYLSPLELQIAYKLYLGSDKDFEDARHLYRFLKAYLDVDKLKYFLKEMRIRKGTVKGILGEDIEI
jgi:hypothetical protein